MKNRNIPFGYQYQNGVVVLHPDEAKTVKRIFNAYLGGSSLLNIADLLNRERIEYLPGIAGWNKARLKRLIEDERYLGKEPFPPIIDSDVYEKIQSLKAQRNTQKMLDRTADIYKINVPVFCPVCGNLMRRQHDSRMKCQEKWICRNKECRETIQISDSVLLQYIADQLNAIIQNPDIIQNEKVKNTEPSIEVRRMENEIGRALDGVSFNKEELRNKMLKCASLKYEGLDTTEHITECLKADFEKSSPLSAFSMELFSRTVKGLRFYTDGKVSLILINGQEIGKEKIYDTDGSNTAENSTVHTGRG